MSHPRTQLREAMRDGLIGLPAVGNNVFLSRTRLWAPSELPGITVYMEPEESGEYSPPTQIRTLKLATDIVVRCAPNEDVDAKLDAIALDLERATMDNLALRTLVLDFYLESSDPEVSDGGDQTIATLQLIWAITYQVDLEDLENIPN